MMSDRAFPMSLPWADFPSFVLRSAAIIVPIQRAEESVITKMMAGDLEEPEIRDYVSWPEIATWSWKRDPGTEPIQMWGYNRTLSQLANPLIETGFTFEKIVEQGIEDVAAMSETDKAEIPYLYE